jgi:hypothetical protein
VLVIDRGEQRVDELARSALRPHRERAGVERRSGAAVGAHLDDERDALLRRHRLDQEERELGIDRLELNRVDRVVDERRHRHDRLRVTRFAQQPHGADANLLLGVAQVADDVFELRGLCGSCRRQHDDRRQRQQYSAVPRANTTDLWSRHESSSGGRQYCNRPAHCDDEQTGGGCGRHPSAARLLPLLPRLIFAFTAPHFVPRRRASRRPASR